MTMTAELPLYAVASMRGRLGTPELVRKFIEAGNATLTVASRGSGQRFTFKFQRPEDPQKKFPGAAKPPPIFAKVLTGQDNEGDYSFIGTLFPPKLEDIRFSGKSRVAATAPSVKALSWMLHHLYGSGQGVSAQSLFRQAEFWHEGRCGRCGRKLTVPSSIASGFGPDCMAMMGGG